ncbi:Uncharacterized protein Fot_37501 [Forsythia ovata]|uniref:Uncharacterized protein n=1 Tax=Forsythia ovata TaxID=205694 RepID=A0ABD1RZ64_9LAMI
MEPPESLMLRNSESVASLKTDEEKKRAAEEAKKRVVEAEAKRNASDSKDSKDLQAAKRVRSEPIPDILRRFLKICKENLTSEVLELLPVLQFVAAIASKRA